MYKWYTLVYVFDASAKHGCEFKRRVPRFIARMMIKRSFMCLDYSKDMANV